MPGHMILIGFYMILALVVSIRYYNSIPFYLYIEWPGLAISMALFIFLTYTVAAQQYEQSVAFSESMKGHPNLNIAIKAELKSLRPMRLECGIFFYVSLTTAFSFFIKVLENTITVLLI